MNEEVLYSARTHPKALFKSALILLCLLLLHIVFWRIWPESFGWDWLDKWGAVLVHGTLAFLMVWYVVVPGLRWWNSLFTLTNKRVKMDWGVIYKHSREIDLTRIASISEERGILDRIFGCGTLNFYDAAAQAQPHTGGVWNESMSNSGVKFKDVPNVKDVRARVEKAKYSALGS